MEPSALRPFIWLLTDFQNGRHIVFFMRGGMQGTRRREVRVRFSRIPASQETCENLTRTLRRERDSV